MAEMDDPTASPPGDQLTCRICRSEANADEPLFHPCRCSGSIQWVHQECLMEWLSHSNKKHCELCKTPFRFTKLYDANMPSVLPWQVFARRAFAHTGLGLVGAGRLMLVSAVWMVILPYFIRYSWRWMFWFADAGWARDAFLHKLRAGASFSQTSSNTTSTEHSVHSKAFDFAKAVLGSWGTSRANNTVHFGNVTSWPEADASVFSSWSYLSSLTPSIRLNRILLDIFEGQLITCIVILGFILVFLIREWVVQQQPLANLDQADIGNVGLDANERHERNEQARRELEELRRIRDRIENLQAERAAVVEAARQHEQQLEQTDFSELGPIQTEPKAASETDRFIEDADNFSDLQVRLDNTSALSSANPEFDRRMPGAHDWRHANPSDRLVLSPKPQPEPVPGDMMEEFPLTNAGAETKLIFKQSIKGKEVPVSASVDRSGPTSSSANTDLQSEKAVQAIPEAVTTVLNAAPTAEPDRGITNQDSTPVNDNPFHPDGPEPERTNTIADTNHFSSAFREEFELDAHKFDERSTSLAQIPQDDTHIPSPAPDEEEEEQRLVDERPKTASQKFADWFWDGIEARHQVDPPVIDAEERLPENGAANEAPFVPFDNGQPALHQHHPDHDPEVAEAARQAGLDAEAVEDAEDIEGIMELIGLQGPLVGLLHTSMFCLILVTATVLGAVALPYVWGKAVLIFGSSPMYFLITLPLQIASFIADFVVDATLFISSLIVTVVGVLSEGLLHILSSTIAPRIQNWDEWAIKISTVALAEVNASGERLCNMFILNERVDPSGLNSGFLGASVHSHLSLKELQNESDAVLALFGSLLHKFVNVVVHGRYHEVWSMFWASCSRVPPASTIWAASLNASQPYTDSVVDTFKALRHGSITLPLPASRITNDAALVFWNSNDRTLTVLMGYLALAMLAAIYVAMDTSVTTSASGQRTEKSIRDSLRQAGGVLKVILIISIEMLVFPLYCGLLLDLAFLPLLPGSNLATRMAFAASMPYTFGFVHWFIGTCYMFHFALFVGMCRKILRKGVLWFIRDPDDPTFHPVRDVLERGVTIQLRKIGFAAIVYGALVILCLGGVIWAIGKIFEGIFPIHWLQTEPFLEFPVDLLLYNIITPLLLRFFKPSDAVHAMYAWWLKRCARALRLSHFLFDEPNADEEGHYVHKSWSSWLLPRKPKVSVKDDSSESRSSKITTDETRVSFERDGKYVYTPSNDQYKPPKAGESFQKTSNNEFYVADKDGKRLHDLTHVYIPPHFKLRVTLFMTCLWVFSACIGLGATLVPLVIGRATISLLLPSLQLNDLYAYSLGAYALGLALVLALRGATGIQTLRKKVSSLQGCSLIWTLATFVLQVAKCLYVYGFFGLVLPLVVGLVLQLYLMLPLHTYLASGTASSGVPASSNINEITLANATVPSLLSNGTSPSMLPLGTGTEVVIVEHTIHLLQDLVLGALYLRVAARIFLSGPGSRAAEAVRRTTREGVLNPDAKLATRFMVLPSLILGALVLLVPYSGAWIALHALAALGVAFSAEGMVLLFRYSYPAAASVMVTALVLQELGKATARWRMRIRDEVYLVGERLHNYGEQKPPAGSRSVVRRDLAR